MSDYEPIHDATKLASLGFDIEQLDDAAHDLANDADFRQGHLQLDPGNEHYFHLETLTAGREVGQFTVPIPVREPGEDDERFLTRCFDLVATAAIPRATATALDPPE